MVFLVGTNLVFARLYALPAKRAITRIAPTALHARDATIPNIFIVRGAGLPGMGVYLKIPFHESAKR
jgi:hypothetical protein